MFGVLKDRVRIVVFNACHSEAQALAVAEHIEMTLGMSRTIKDRHAIAFAAEFYQAMAYDRTVKEAYNLGIARLIGEGEPDARNLVTLHTRPCVDVATMKLIPSVAQTEAPNPPATDLPSGIEPVPVGDGKSTPDQPKIGIITALPLESAAVRVILENPNLDDETSRQTGRNYWKGTSDSLRGGTHTFVLAQAGMGNSVAAIRATNMLEHYRDIEMIIMCRIAGGIPHHKNPAEHVRLGDIVVSDIKGVVSSSMTSSSASKVLRMAK